MPSDDKILVSCTDGTCPVRTRVPRLDLETFILLHEGRDIPSFDDVADPHTAVPCPACETAGRDGTLVYVPQDAPETGLEVPAVLEGIDVDALWKRVQVRGTALVDAFSDLLPEDQATPTGTVLEGRPYGGHELRHGNDDDRPQYGEGPVGTPSPSPRYIRELKHDLLYLGYYGDRARQLDKRNGGVGGFETMLVAHDGHRESPTRKNVPHSGQGTMEAIVQPYHYRPAGIGLDGPRPRGAVDEPTDEEILSLLRDEGSSRSALDLADACATGDELEGDADRERAEAAADHAAAGEHERSAIEDLARDDHADTADEQQRAEHGERFADDDGGATAWARAHEHAIAVGVDGEVAGLRVLAGRDEVVRARGDRHVARCGAHATEAEHAAARASARGLLGHLEQLELRARLGRFEAEVDGGLGLGLGLGAGMRDGGREHQRCHDRDDSDSITRANHPPSVAFVRGEINRWGIIAGLRRWLRAGLFAAPRWQWASRRRSSKAPSSSPRIQSCSASRSTSAGFSAESTVRSEAAGWLPTRRAEYEA